MTEFAFDVKLWAVCRVQAKTEEEARAKMLDFVTCLDLGFDRDGVKFTEASLEDESGRDSELIEINGEAI